jgi:hypothetical protein
MTNARRIVFFILLHFLKIIYSCLKRCSSIGLDKVWFLDIVEMILKQMHLVC